MIAPAQTKTAYWERNKQGNRALGALYSGLTDRVLALNITLSMARWEFPTYDIIERRP